MLARRLPLSLLLLLFLAAPAAAQEWAPAALEMKPVRLTGGRTPLPTGLSYAEALTDDAAWTPVEASQPGTFAARSVRGLVRVEVPADAVADVTNQHGIALLDVRCAGTVWIDGRPRPGDAYGYGFVTLPVQLDRDAGSTIHATPSRRGDLVLRLRRPAGDVVFLDGDATLPDFVLGEAESRPAAVLVANATPRPIEASLRVSNADGIEEEFATRLPACSVMKVPFEVVYTGGDSTGAALSLGDATRTVSFNVKRPGLPLYRTFVSELDRSVQRYSVQPAADEDARAMVLSTHGASVESMNQARAYGQKSWAHVVCPTNRRPFGFDWESWGRVDALEALADARRTWPAVADDRVYLTGHSMGGHGAWYLGSLYPDGFAAVAPSAGWLAFDTYGGGGTDPAEPRGPVPEDENERVLFDAAGLSDPRIWLANLRGRGVYILHGDADETVPARQAIAMSERLDALDIPHELHLEPGAGHWWDDAPDEPGAACVDWPPMFDLFARTRLPEMEAVSRVQFTTPDPAVSDTRAWARVVRADQPLKPSSIDLQVHPQSRRFEGSAENVAILELNVSPTLMNGQRPVHMMIEYSIGEAHGAMSVGLDGKVWIALTETGDRLLEEYGRVEPPSAGQGGGKWKPRLADAPVTRLMQAYTNRPVFVYATGDDGWAAARARHDAEQLWYRGNGRIDVIADVEFDQADDQWSGRNVVLYGNATNHVGWAELVGDRVDVTAGRVAIDGETFDGDDLVLLAALPHPAEDGRVIGIVGGTSPAAAIASDGLPIFVSGVHYPRATVLRRKDRSWTLVRALR